MLKIKWMLSLGWSNLVIIIQSPFYWFHSHAIHVNDKYKTEWILGVLTDVLHILQSLFHLLMPNTYKIGQFKSSKCLLLKVMLVLVISCMVIVNISVTPLGDLMGPTFSGLEKLIQMPSGCGEQTMLSLAPNVFILDYLNSTGALTPAIETKCKGYILSGRMTLFAIVFFD